LVGVSWCCATDAANTARKDASTTASTANIGSVNASTIFVTVQNALGLMQPTAVAMPLKIAPTVGMTTLTFRGLRTGRTRLYRSDGGGEFLYLLIGRFSAYAQA
jgi:hypothetical protein